MKSHELVERINNGEIKDGTKIKVKNINDDSAYVPHIEYIGNSLKYLKGTYEDGDFVSNSVLFNKNFEFEIVEEHKGWFKPKMGKGYFYITSSGIILSKDWNGNEIDNYLYEHHNCFRTKAEAQEYLDYKNALKEAEKPFVYDGFNYFIYYYNDDLRISCNETCRTQGITYLGQDKDAVQAFIDKWKKQILKYEFDVWE